MYIYIFIYIYIYIYIYDIDIVKGTHLIIHTSHKGSCRNNGCIYTVHMYTCICTVATERKSTYWELCGHTMSSK